MSPIIEQLVLDQVSFSYTSTIRKPIIHDLSMQIPLQSVTTLLGLNGAGKTTLMMLLLGYFQPTSGKIYIMGSEGKRSIEEINGQVGYLPQRENIPFDYYVAEFILLGRNNQIGIFSTPNETDMEKVQQAMQFLQIEEFAARRLSNISGGELQRVRIARLLVQDPKIILLDEPSSHLDIKSRGQMQDLILQLKEMGKMIIYSTHDPADALNFSDYSVLMKKGENIISGASARVITSETLSDCFETALEINQINGQKIVLMENNRNGNPKM